MQELRTSSSSISDFTSRYEHHLVSVRGLALTSVGLHRRVVEGLFRFRFPDGQIVWSEFEFSVCVGFLRKEFARLHNRETQRVWLMVLRSVLRYLGEEGYIAKGWEAALPTVAQYRYAPLPRNLSEERVRDLWDACCGTQPRHLRYRAILSLSLGLGLRIGEVANLRLEDIDWKNGDIRIKDTKTHRDRILPLPEDVGEALVAHLKATPPRTTRVFEPRRPPFTDERRHHHVENSMRYLFALAGITDRGPHSLRHTAATEMVSKGASFKDVADVLGHKSVTTTLIYAKLDLKALMQVALQWPGGAQ
jgi:integrase